MHDFNEHLHEEESVLEDIKKLHADIIKCPVTPIISMRIIF